MLEAEVKEQELEQEETLEEDVSAKEEVSEEENPPVEEAAAEESEEEEGKPSLDEKASVQKRINKLTAKITNLEKENADLKEEIAFEQSKINDKVEKVRKSLPDHKYKKASGEVVSVYDLTDREFNKVVKESLETGLEPAVLSQIIADRDVFIEQAEPLAEKQGKVNTDRQKVWDAEWNEVETLLVGDTKELEKQLPAIKKHISEKLEKSIYWQEKLYNGGIREKIKFSLKALDELGLSDLVEAEIYEQDRPAPAAPVGTGKSNKVTTAKAPTFTRAQIAKMSLEEFEKNRAAIDAAHKAGRVT